MSAPVKKTDVNPRAPDAQRNKDLARKLLAWYRAQHRKLPWRAAPGERQDPYAVWLSEIMLQQTTVATVIPYYLKFMTRWPTMKALAEANIADVMSAWAGLGYYSRARNLHACAVQVTNEYDGSLPAGEAELLKLPGIGPYTAAAISSIAFGKQAAPVDGNIERVLSRLMCIEEPLPASKPVLKEIAQQLAPLKHAGDFAQAMMDLGATICTPRSPSCLICPWREECGALAAGIAADLPRRADRKTRPVKRAATFVMLTASGEVFLERRQDKGLLAGMHGTPVTAFEEEFPEHPLKAAPVKAPFIKAPTRVTHTFTHFDLELDVYVAELPKHRVPGIEGEWAPMAELDRFALPTLFRKVIRTARSAQPKGKGRRSFR
jgi:A/G-specific adenine glycosylase